MMEEKTAAENGKNANIVVITEKFSYIRVPLG